MVQDTNGAVRKGYLPSKYGQLHYRYAAPAEAKRTGLPVLLFGCVPCSSVAFKELLGELATDRVAIAFDSPGYGQSDTPPTALPSPLDYAAIFIAALDELGVEKVDVFGDHSGAVLALAMAAFAPDRVGKVVAAATPYVVDRELRTQRAGRWPVYTSTDPIPAHEQGKFKRYVLSRPPELSLDRAMEIYTDGLTPGIHTNYLFLAAYDANAEAWLTGLETPVRFVQTDDWLTENNVEVAKIIKNPSFKERRDLNYFAYYVKADQFALEIREFCDADDVAAPVAATA